MKRLFFSLLFLTLMIAWPAQADIPEICQSGENLLKNCQFNEGMTGWNSFIEEGNAAFSVLQGGGECHAPSCPAGYIVTEDYFVGGIYQQIPAVAGNTYQANIVWLGFDSLTNDKSIRDVVGGIGRKMGIDPLGGTDPKAASIVWGQESSDTSCRLCNGYEVIATAQADKITVFLRFDDRWRIHARDTGHPVPPSKDQFWLDDIGARQVSGSAAPAAATDTPVPATDTPAPAAPTNTPNPPTNTPTTATEVKVASAEEETATPEVTVTISETTDITVTETMTAVTATNTPSANMVMSQLATVPLPPPTLTPTSTPSPTPTESATEVAVRKLAAPPSLESPKSVPTQSALIDENWLTLAGPLACGVGASFIALALFLVGLVWLYRVGTTSTQLPPPDSMIEPVTVEFIDDEEDL